MASKGKLVALTEKMDCCAPLLELDTVSEDNYKDSTCIMQPLRDNKLAEYFQQKKVDLSCVIETEIATQKPENERNFEFNYKPVKMKGRVMFTPRKQPKVHPVGALWLVVAIVTVFLAVASVADSGVCPFGTVKNGTKCLLVYCGLPEDCTRFGPAAVCDTVEWQCECPFESAYTSADLCVPETDNSNFSWITVGVIVLVSVLLLILVIGLSCIFCPCCQGKCKLLSNLNCCPRKSYVSNVYNVVNVANVDSSAPVPV